MKSAPRPPAAARARAAPLRRRTRPRRAARRARERVEEDVDALLLDELAEVDDGRRPIAREKRRPVARRSRRRAGVRRVTGVRRVATSLVDEAGERGAALPRGRPQLDVDARRDLVHALHVPADLLEHRRGCARSRRTWPRPTRATPRPSAELRDTPHRVLELRAVRLDRVPRPVAAPTAPRAARGCKDEVGRELARTAAAFASTQVSSSSRVQSWTRLAPRSPRSGRGRRPAGSRRRPGGPRPRRRGRRLGAGLLAEHRRRRAPRGSTRGRAARV